MHRPQYEQNSANAKRQRVSMRVPLAYEWYVGTIHDLTEAGGEQLRCECEHGVGVQKSRCENYIEVEDSTLDGGCANCVALFLKTSLVKLELCQTMCRQMISPSLGQIRT